MAGWLDCKDCISEVVIEIHIVSRASMIPSRFFFLSCKISCGDNLALEVLEWHGLRAGSCPAMQVVYGTVGQWLWGFVGASLGIDTMLSTDPRHLVDHFDFCVQ